MKNGRTKAAIISAACVMVASSIGLAGWWGGMKTKIGREAVREERIDTHLIVAESGFARLEAVEKRSADTGQKINGLSDRVDNLDDNVRTLIESQEKTNEKLQRLSDTLMDYLSSQARRTPTRP